jgi:membrane protease YdiL (CAAX protease family)
MASAVAFVVVALATGVDLENVVNDQSILAQPGFVLLNNLLLAALIPIAMLGVWAGHQWRPRWVSSVVGGVRWRWLGECAVISLVLMVVSSVVLYAIDGWPQGAPEKQAVALLLIVFLTTPFQAAGEEYFMRGWMTQTVGALFARPVVGALVAGLISSTVFALAHGSQNAWLFADRFAFGVIASYLTWRTGGLEAAVAAHAVNNVVVFVPVILTGGLQESLLISEAPAGVVVLDVVSLTILAAVLLWWARRRGVQRLYRPGPPPSDGVQWQLAVQGPAQHWEPPGEPPVLVDPDRLR